MTSKVLFFSIDRLGDYLIRSNVIKEISKHYTSTEIVTSDINFKLINSQTFFDKIVKFDKNKNSKFEFLKKYFLKEYDAVISFDGKRISKLLLFFIKSKFKYIFIHEKKGFLNKIFFFINILLFKIFKIQYSILINRELIETGKNDNYPNKYKRLNKLFNNNSQDTYYIEQNNIVLKIKNDFILIHLDEKFDDILNRESNLNEIFINFSKKSDKKIILTSYNNNSRYYKNFLIKKVNFSNLHEYNNDDKIIIIENIPLNYFFEFIKKSFISISCHAGMIVHPAIYYKKKCIDIIHYHEINWVNCWTEESKYYKRIYKSVDKKNFRIKDILNEILILTKKY
jgi:ADP-heptose:LPS heptosyltransferase